MTYSKLDKEVSIILSGWYAQLHSEGTALIKDKYLPLPDEAMELFHWESQIRDNFNWARRDLSSLGSGASVMSCKA